MLARGFGPQRMKRKLLLVDDNHDSAVSLQTLLEMAGHEVVVAHDGAHALQEAARFAPDAVLLDIGLPDMDGYEIARRLRASAATRGVQIIAISGYGCPDHLRRSREAGIDEHLVKPLDLKVLANLLGRGVT